MPCTIQLTTSQGHELRRIVQLLHREHSILEGVEVRHALKSLVLDIFPAPQLPVVSADEKQDSGFGIQDSEKTILDRKSIAAGEKENE